MARTKRQQLNETEILSQVNGYKISALDVERTLAEHSLIAQVCFCLMPANSYLIILVYPLTAFSSRSLF
jgi:hypothetical protein